MRKPRIPCKKCILFPICKVKYVTYKMEYFYYVTMINSCSLLHDYWKEVSIKTFRKDLEKYYE